MKSEMIDGVRTAVLRKTCLGDITIRQDDDTDDYPITIFYEDGEPIAKCGFSMDALPEQAARKIVTEVAKSRGMGPDGLYWWEKGKKILS